VEGDPGKSQHPLESIAQEIPYGQNIFLLLRRLQGLFPDHPKVGSARRPRAEVHFLRQVADLRFAPSTLSGFSFETRDDRPFLRIDHHLPGLMGPQGALPLVFTDYILTRRRHHFDPTTEAFLNIFQHRFFSLLFRSWALNRKEVDLDTPSEGRICGYFGALIGMKEPSQRESDSIPWQAKWFFSGYFAGAPRNRDSLEALLKDFFEVNVVIRDFYGHWLKMPRECCSRLGEHPDTGTVGMSLVLGSRFFDRQLKFRICLGPMNYEAFQSFLPGSRNYQILMDWVRLFTRRELDWDLQLILKKEEIPPCIPGKGLQLGYNCWLTSKEPEKDVCDSVFQPDTTNALLNSN